MQIYSWLHNDSLIFVCVIDSIIEVLIWQQMSMYKGRCTTKQWIKSTQRHVRFFCFYFLDKIVA